MSSTDSQDRENTLLFVGGFPGGGTDLLKSILNAHALIYINGEMPLLNKLPQYGYSANTRFESLEQINEFKSTLRTLNTWGNIQNLDQKFTGLLKQEKSLSLNEVLRICFSLEEREVWGNKTPQNTENIQTLSTLFPEALFLTVVRDVRDVCLSWRNKWGKDVLACSSKWAIRMERGLQSANKLSMSRCHFVKFEDLITKTETSCRDISDFLGVPFSDRMLHHQDYTTEKLDGKINYGRGVISDNQQKWKGELSSKTIQRIEEIAYDTIYLYGYEPACATRSRSITQLEKTIGAAKDVWATISVGNRSSQQNTLRLRIKELAWELKKRL